jgi:uncharacterized protein (TIGR02246 family)
MSQEQHTATAKADIAAIDRVREAHVAALNQGDADAWAAVFSEDAVQMPPNAPANVGSAAIRSWGQAFLNQFGTQFSLSVEEVRLAGDWAFERGTYTIVLSPRGGGTLKDVGKYITIYQRQPDGSWKTARDIWNSNQQSPSMQ